MKGSFFLISFSRSGEGLCSFTLGNVCRTPSPLFSPSFPPVYAAFSFTPESRESFFLPPQNFSCLFLRENKAHRGIAWALLFSLPFFCSEFVVFLFRLPCARKLNGQRKIERRGVKFLREFLWRQQKSNRNPSASGSLFVGFVLLQIAKQKRIFTDFVYPADRITDR